MYMTAAILIAASAQAQSAWDAYNYSSTDYIGTARSLGMGNAMTAVGGDIGSVGFNPAGSAVSGYSQIEISSGISVTKLSAQGTPLSGSTDPYGFENRTNSSHTKFIVPNNGFILDFDTHSSGGLKNFSIGFLCNFTNNYNREIQALGTNTNTSVAGALAMAADGYLSSDLNSSTAFDRGYPWGTIVAYQGGLISTYGGYNNAYIGATENIYGSEIALADAITQKYSQLTTGWKSDMIINFAANFNDKFYVGANLGIVSLEYTSDELIREMTNDPRNFEAVYEDGSKSYLNDLRYRFKWDASGSGIYAKVGFIYKPFAGLRIAAAVQTPTATDITETSIYEAASYYTDSRFNAKKTSPRSEYSYSLVSPAKYNFGVAYTIGKFALISADYERCNYSNMRLSDIDDYFDDSFFYENQDIQNYFGWSDELRLGVELRLSPSLSVRGGYNRLTSPEMDGNNEYLGLDRKSYSYGVGYSSKGSFYADFAIRNTKLPDQYVYPYSDYLDADGNVLVYSPEIHVSKIRTCDAILTLGWRF